LTIAVIVAAIALAAPTGGTSLWLVGATGWTAATAGAVIGMAVMTAGMLLVNAIAPIKYNASSSAIAAKSYNDSDTYSIGASSNKEKPWGRFRSTSEYIKPIPPRSEVLYRNSRWG